MDNKKEEKNYDLYTEHIVKEPWLRIKAYIRKILIILIMAVFFGLTAGLVMLLVYKTGRDYFNEGPGRESITLSGETSSSEDSPSESESVTISVPETTPALPTQAPDEVPDEDALKDYNAYYESLKKVSDKVKKSMVTVTVSRENVDRFNSTYQNVTEEYGLVVADGENGYYILTDFSMVENAASIIVTYPDGASDTANLIAGDVTTNFAVIRTEHTDNNSVVPALLSDSASVSQGTPVIAVGKLYGFSGSMGYGMATGVDNIVNDTDASYRLINTDISGTENSSGVVANLSGRIVGIITTSYNSGSSNPVTAYAVSDIISLVERLCNGRKTAYLGIKGQEVTESLRTEKGIPSGIYVSVVETNSPAYSTGIQTGDIICRINSKPVSTMKEFMSMINSYGSGESIDITVKRNGRDVYKEIEFNVMLGVE